MGNLKSVFKTTISIFLILLIIFTLSACTKEKFKTNPYADLDDDLYNDDDDGIVDLGQELTGDAANYPNARNIDAAKMAFMLEEMYDFEVLPISGIDDYLSEVRFGIAFERAIKTYMCFYVFTVDLQRDETKYNVKDGNMLIDKKLVDKRVKQWFNADYSITAPDTENCYTMPYGMGWESLYKIKITSYEKTGNSAAMSYDLVHEESGYVGSFTAQFDIVAEGGETFLRLSKYESNSHSTYNDNDNDNV